MDKEQALRELKRMPNVGPAIAGCLIRLGVSRPGELVGRDPVEMYETLCAIDDRRLDPCVLDVFMAAVDFAGGAAARPWWAYTAKRKAMMRARTVR
ncbi:MAG: helix-hairpin-helix domain-containing protein [Phycisphaerae bacterium]